MFRYELEIIGEGNQVRIIAQYQRKMYGRRLLTRVSRLDDYLKYGTDIHIDELMDVYYEIPEYITDHVQLDISGIYDKRLTNYIETGDILICTCDVYRYEYSGEYSGYNYGLNNPKDIILMKPFYYDKDNKVVYIVQSDKSRITYWYYVGQNSRMNIESDWWDFTKLKELARKHDYTNLFGEDIHCTGYEIVDDNNDSIQLIYAEKNSELKVYKSISDCVNCEII